MVWRGGCQGGAAVDWSLPTHKHGEGWPGSALDSAHASCAGFQQELKVTALAVPTPGQSSSPEHCDQAEPDC